MPPSLIDRIKQKYGQIPLPYAQSGAADEMAQAAYQAERTNRDLNTSWGRFTTDMGVNPMMKKGQITGYNVQSKFANPNGFYQQTMDTAQNASANQGFGFDGRIAQLKAAKPLASMHMNLKRGLDDKSLAQQDNMAQYRLAMAQGANTAANWGAENNYHRLPTPQAVNAAIRGRRGY